ncbi:MAG: hypothetical protein O2V44_07115 [Candidatus Bathyarchaeota archaeon]|nr:hypothetical protein [Candidatus Bathyarchaeota archaeon]
MFKKGSMLPEVSNHGIMHACIKGYARAEQRYKVYEDFDHGENLLLGLDEFSFFERPQTLVDHPIDDIGDDCVYYHFDKKF